MTTVTMHMVTGPWQQEEIGTQNGEMLEHDKMGGMRGCNAERGEVENLMMISNVNGRIWFNLHLQLSIGIIEKHSKFEVCNSISLDWL